MPAEPTAQDALHPAAADADDSERERAALRQTLQEQTEHLDRLAALVDASMQQQQELRRLLQDAHAQLFERDEALERLRTQLHDLDTQLVRERRQLGRLQASRWWRLRQTIARLVGR
jgi:hypothetical protein